MNVAAQTRSRCASVPAIQPRRSRDCAGRAGPRAAQQIADRGVDVDQFHQTVARPAGGLGARAAQMMPDRAFLRRKKTAVFRDVVLLRVSARRQARTGWPAPRALTERSVGRRPLGLSSIRDGPCGFQTFIGVGAYS